MAKGALAAVMVSLLALSCISCDGHSRTSVGHRIAGGATTTPAPSPAPGVLNSAVLACKDYINTAAPPPGMRIVGGVVALPVSPQMAALQTVRTGSTHHAVRLYAKEGLWIKTGEPFTLSVPRRLGGVASIGWGPSVTPAVTLNVPSCHTGRAQWMSYPGGYFVRHTLCLPLVVRAHGKRESVPIGVGVGCPGQKPPPAPTQR